MLVQVILSFDVRRYAAALLLWLPLLVLVPATEASAASLSIHAIDAQSGEPIADLEVHAFEEGLEGALIWRNRGITDAAGALTLDLAGLGSGTSYVLASLPFNGGYSLSSSIQGAGSFDYRLGALEVTVIDGNDNAPLTNHEVGAFEILPEGETRFATHGITDEDGKIRFDLPGLGGERRYFLYSYRPLDDSYFPGEELTGEGTYTFKVGHKLLNARVVDGLSGDPLTQQVVHLMQEQPGGSFYVASGVTDSDGRVDFELEELENGASYQLITEAFNNIPAYSDAITTSGQFVFSVGKLRVAVVNGVDGTPLVNYPVSAVERFQDGTDGPGVEGVTDGNGIVRLDLPGLGQGQNYVLYAASTVDGSRKTSPVLVAAGDVVFTVGGQPLRVTLTNEITGDPLALQSVVVVTLDEEGAYSVVAVGQTDAAGKVSFDLDELGQGKSVALVTEPYNGGWAISDWISQPGDTSFTVGRLPVQLIDGDTGQALPGKTLVLLERQPNGQLNWVSQGTTDGQGIVRFQAPALGAGSSYTVLTENVYGEGRQFFSPWITAVGEVIFQVSRDGDYAFDGLPPDLQVINPDQGQTVSSGGFLVEGTVSDDRGVRDLVIEIVDGNLGSSLHPVELDGDRWSYIVPASALSSPSVVGLSVRAHDLMGNETLVEVDLNAVEDVVPPLVSVSSHTDQDTVSGGGFLLTGYASDNLGLQQLTATVSDSVQGPILDNVPVPVAPGTGNWALVVEPGGADRQLHVQLTARDFDGQESSDALDLSVVAPGAAIGHAINRISFGPTAQLLDETRGQGADVYIAGQLNWLGIDDSALEAMLVDFGMPKTPAELQEYELLRAVYSKRQLLEKMTWFWENHFNTDLNKSGSVAYEFQENQLFRSHALGRFRDLLQVSATSPAMLLYLDNVTNYQEGPNENYARELLELHTLGVSGGYSEEDVTEVARVFTGWSLQGDQFHFYDQLHDTGVKTVLGQTIESGSGVDEGNQVLDILASHPATARHICLKLEQYFVTDTPDAGYVDQCASIFLASDGDIGTVVAWILGSSEFSSAPNVKNKVKTPMEFLVGVVRGLSPTVFYGDIRYFLDAMGMPIFQCPPPKGWPEAGVDWINVDQLSKRLQAVSYLLFSSAAYGGSYIEDPRAPFVARGLESEDAVLGYLAEVTLSDRFSGVAWAEARNALTEGLSAGFDIQAEDADARLRSAIAVMFSTPEYHLQ